MAKAKPTQCPKCKKKFANAYRLNRHKQKKFSCAPAQVKEQKKAAHEARLARQRLYYRRAHPNGWWSRWDFENNCWLTDSALREPNEEENENVTGLRQGTAPVTVHLISDSENEDENETPTIRE